MAVHAFFFFPETAGKTLEEVEDLFLSGTPAWKTRVNYKGIKAKERGEIDPEKSGQFRHANSVSTASTKHDGDQDIIQNEKAI